MAGNDRDQWFKEAENDVRGSAPIKVYVSNR